MFVLDASLTLAWHFEDEGVGPAEEIAQRALELGIVVPQHWLMEIVNGLVRGERRARTSAAATAGFLARLDILDKEVDAIEADRIASLLLPLARAHRLSVYDVAYLELAERRGLPLATLDRSLANAALSVGVKVLGPAGDRS
jgi:predicted nucleic acid-binding protein